MSAQVPRDPMHPSSAAARAVAILTAKRIAAMFSFKGTRRVYKWTEPNTNSIPTVRQAMEIDKHCIMEVERRRISTPDDAPFASFFQRWGDGHRTVEANILVTAATTAEHAASLSRLLVEARHPASEDGSDVSINELAEISEKIEQVGGSHNQTSRAHYNNMKPKDAIDDREG